MVFSSLLFLFRFLPAVLLLYYVAPKKLRNFILFASSLVFYAWGEPVYVVLILFSTLVDYFAGRTVDYCKETGHHKGAVAALLCSVLINLSLLGFFKYGNFVLQNVGGLLGLALPTIHLGLPIGISFYTFQTMSYTIDVFRGKAKVQKNIITFGTYVALFPQLIAGPIVRYTSVENQMQNRKESLDLFCDGILRFMIGLGKKVLIANPVGMLWDEIAAMDGTSITTATAWLGAIAFTLQIYFDFSGYSDMAIGLGKMFGFQFPENFNYPYLAGSITEFWRRWHISLGTWFREYVYIPLGGNRKGMTRQMINIGIVWFLTGLWHGASWNFVLWGLYYGILLVIEKALWKPVLLKLPKMIGHIYTILAVVIGWMIFSWQDMADSQGFMRAFFFQGKAGLVNQNALYLLFSYIILITIGIFGSGSWLTKQCNGKLFPRETKRRYVAIMVFTMAVLVASIAMLVNSTYNPFLYFRF